MLSHRETARSGRRALSVRKARNPETSTTCMYVPIMSTNDTCKKYRYPIPDVDTPNVHRSTVSITYPNDDKVQNGPEAGKVLFHAKSKHLQDQLDEEEHGEDDVEVIESRYQLRTLMDVDVFEAEYEAARDDQKHDQTLEYLVGDNPRAEKSQVPPMSGAASIEFRVSAADGGLVNLL